MRINYAFLATLVGCGNLIVMIIHATRESDWISGLTAFGTAWAWLQAGQYLHGKDPYKI